jgi:hypothetical protein
MVQSQQQLISEFLAALGPSSAITISHEGQPAPHTSHVLPIGKCAIYVFSLSEGYGSTVPAGPSRVLKVGKAGPNSNARFQSDPPRVTSLSRF